MISREVSITLESDWTHGSGQRGDDNADIAIQRDASGRPLLRGTHLTGLVREALPEVIAMLVKESAKDKAVWKSWLTVLCGNETHAGALSIRTAYADIVTPIGLRPGVAINPDTGTAADDQLRLAQRVGTVKLTTSAVLGERSGDGRRLAWSKDQITAAWLLAEAAMGLVEAVGSERHRGAGRAVIAWADKEPKLTARLQQLKTKPVPPPAATAETRPRVGGTPVSEEWKRFTVGLTLSDPLHANAGVRSNTMLGHPYLPGTALLPWLHQQLRRIDAEDIVRDAVVNGGLLAGNAYPVVESRPTWPAPLGLSSRGRWVTQSCPHDFVDGAPMLLVPHNTIDPTKGRTKTEAGFYQVVAIADGSILEAEVLLNTDVCRALPEGWETKIDTSGFFGAKSGAAYGGAKVCVSGGVPATPTTPNASDGSLTVWLLSDLLLRSPSFAAAGVFDVVKALQQLGVGVTDPQLGEVHVQTKRIDSWSGNAPRPTLITLSAGSTLRLRWDGSGAEVLAKVALTGFGERRAEGFGRMAFQHPLLGSQPALPAGGLP